MLTDITYICEKSQLSAGLQCGIEGAIQAVNDVFNDSDDFSVLLIDASNAFNSINRIAMLWNVRVL